MSRRVKATSSYAAIGRQWLLEDAPSWLVVALAALLGVVVGGQVFGLGYIAGTSEFWKWPAGDASMMLTGWEYYVHEPWHFPLAQTFGTNGPDGMNLLYMDAIPLVAFLGKIGRTLTGGTWHPYGLWHFALYVLQTVVATLAARRLGLRSVLGGLGVAMLALSMYAFLSRFYHEGLNAHFVLLWAVLAYARTEAARPVWKVAVEWIGCVGCAVLCHPYLGVMTAALAAAALARLAALTPRRAAVVAGCTGAGLVAILFAFGYLPQHLPPDPGDFGRASMNLMSPVVPFYGTLSPQPNIVQDGTGIQWDGANFLGLGVLALLLVAVTGAPRTVKELVLGNKALVVVLALLALYAPANHWYLGRTELLHYELPERIKPFLNNVRATGRFFWPVGYALLLAACTVVQRRFAWRGAIVVFLAGAVQFVDSTMERGIVRKAMETPAKHEIDRAAWSAELRGVSRVNMYPSFYCWPFFAGLPPALWEKEREIELVAASSGMRTNAGRAGRPLTDCARELGERTRAETAVPRAGETDVFFRPVYGPETLPELDGRRCVELDGTFVCKAR